uniref:hypothetical protein n=1 Tax=Caulobacter sp. SSI4214 TaxID=2575739 RepID=UPI0019D598A4
GDVLMRLRFGAILLLTAVAACDRTGPTPSASGQTASEVVLKPASVMLTDVFIASAPLGFKLSKPDKRMDFDVYEVRKGPTTYVKIYVGNFPTFPSEGEERTAPSKPIVPEAARIKHPSGAETDEFLLPTKKTNGPRAIHVWALEVPGDQDTANRIAASVKVRE